MDNHNIAITGTLISMTRESAIREIENAGCSFSHNISAKTTALVIGRRPGERKLAKATIHNVKIIWEEQFLEMVGLPHTKAIPGL